MPLAMNGSAAHDPSAPQPAVTTLACHARVAGWVELTEQSILDRDLDARRLHTRRVREGVGIAQDVATLGVTRHVAHALRNLDDRAPSSQAGEEAATHRALDRDRTGRTRCVIPCRRVARCRRERPVVSDGDPARGGDTVTSPWTDDLMPSAGVQGASRSRSPRPRSRRPRSLADRKRLLSPWARRGSAHRRRRGAGGIGDPGFVARARRQIVLAPRVGLTHRVDR